VRQEHRAWQGLSREEAHPPPGTGRLGHAVAAPHLLSTCHYLKQLSGVENNVDAEMEAGTFADAEIHRSQ